MSVRLSIRHKMLLAFLAVLFLAMGTYLYLAISLFNEDKLAYVYDLNSALVDTLSKQTASNLNLTADKLALFARDVLRSDVNDNVRLKTTQKMFQQEKDIFHIEVFKRGQDAQFEQVFSFTNPALMEEHDLDEGALKQMRKEMPVPLDAIAAETDRIYLQNSSLPPSAAMLTLARAHQSQDGLFIITADIRPDRILRIFSKSKLHETYLVDESGEVLAHPDGSKVIGHTKMSEHELVKEMRRESLSHGVREFNAIDGTAMLGAYSKTGVGRLSVITQIPKQEALRARNELIRRSVFFALAILSAAFMMSTIFSRLITAPISKLSDASKAIGKGQFSSDAVDIKSKDEIGELARTFEKMTSELKETQTQLVFSEKMAAFGQLGAGITHEVKNPITGIIGFSQLALMNIDNKEKVQEYLKIIETESSRCSEILLNFLTFVRQDTDVTAALQINELVKDIGKIINHQLMINNVQLSLNLGDDLAGVYLRGNAANLQQVLLNLAINAQQVMPHGGIVTLATEKLDENWMSITVSDTGPGIPVEIQPKIFDPFFTTKAPGEGTGLGLSIVFSIVRDHKGSISLKSSPGEGASFCIRLPIFEPKGSEHRQPIA